LTRRFVRWASSPKPIVGLGLGALLGAPALYYAREVEPEDVEVVPVSIELPRLTPQFDGYRIAQVSDLHVTGWMTPGRLLGLVELVNAEAPDLVVITGDLATYSRFRSRIRHVSGLVAPLRRLRPPDGTIAVLGNHDHKTNAAVVRQALAASGVIELSNAVESLHRDGAALHLCGVDSALKGVVRLSRVLEELPEGDTAILLAHEPDFADTSAQTGRFDLQLSGHSHGGQMLLPLLRTLVAPRLSRKYLSGLYQVGDMLLYTNRGLGSHPRLRLGCRPEITIFTLISRAARQSIRPRAENLPEHRKINQKTDTDS
jgi:predicted MPP superfamily phosphohydrolase